MAILEEVSGESKTPSVCVVIARFSEPLDWLRSLPEDYELYISNSGEVLSREELKTSTDVVTIAPVPNLGREAGHWIRYMVTNYNNLADINVFLQGNPHIGHTTNILFEMERSHLKHPFCYLTSKDCCETIIPCGIARTFVQSSVGRKYKTVPLRSGGVWGGQFYATKETIRNNPLEYYQDLLKAVESDKHKSAYALEYGWNVALGYPPAPAEIGSFGPIPKPRGMPVGENGRDIWNRGKQTELEKLECLKNGSGCIETT